MSPAPKAVIRRLIEQGVRIPCPESMEIAAEIDPERVAPGVLLHAGCRLRGAATSIGPGCIIGAEAPATIEDCQLNQGVELKGGYFAGSVFLDGVNVGSAAHIRAGTLLEEESGGAHAVGLKQTIFMPFVTAGSLINFCDCLMAGGTSRKNHSEIGSSYIHFNYTPQQDKATPSLLGDVPRGVMLEQAPIFLGGQGGLVGPTRIGFGCVIPAGTVYRKDALEDGKLLMPAARSANLRPIPFRPGMYRHIQRIVTNNLHYIGNLRALQAWYRLVRRPFMARDPFASACHEGATRLLDLAVAERLKRMEELAEKIQHSLGLIRAEAGPDLPPYGLEQERFVRQWPTLKAALRIAPEEAAGETARETFLAELERITPGTGYLDAIRSLSPTAKNTGVAWLQAVVARVLSAGERLNQGGCP